MTVPIMFWSFVAYVLFQIIALKRLNGGFYKAAITSAVLGVLIVGLTIYLFVAGSNIFPIFMLYAGPSLFFYLVILISVDVLITKMKLSS